MKVYFVRHGFTESNKLKRIMSRSNDESLNVEGLLQVKNVVNNLASELDYDIVFSSPLKRASETASEFAKHKKLDVNHHEDILEREFGELSNKTWDEVHIMTNGGLNHELWDKVLEYDLSPYGGETSESVRTRVLAFIDHLKKSFSDKKPLVVTHGGVLRTLYALFPEHKLKDFGNVSIHEFGV